eukprot:gene57559-78861_t
MLLGFHYMGFYAGAFGFNEYLASKGYVVLISASAAVDIGAISYLQARPDVDRKRIGVWGGSYGGLMTALALARASDSIAVGVDYAGVYNWASMLATREVNAVRQSVGFCDVSTLGKIDVQG